RKVTVSAIILLSLSAISAIASASISLAGLFAEGAALLQFGPLDRVPVDERAAGRAEILDVNRVAAALQRGVRPAHMGSSRRTSQAGSRPAVMYFPVSSIR